MMENVKIYSTDLIDGTNKKVLQRHACIGCGVEPYYELVNSINGISSYNLIVDGWGLVNEMPYCPICMRIHKIKRIISISI